MAPVTGMTKIKVWVGPDDDLVDARAGIFHLEMGGERRDDGSGKRDTV